MTSRSTEARFSSVDGRMSRIWHSFLYDFAVLAGAQGALTLKGANGDAKQLPSGLIVLGGLVEVVAAVTSGGAATISLDLGATAAAILAATGKASFAVATPINIPSLNSAVSATGAVKLAAATDVKATIGTADLTAGKFYVHLECAPATT